MLFDRSTQLAAQSIALAATRRTVPSVSSLRANFLRSESSHQLHIGKEFLDMEDVAKICSPGGAIAPRTLLT